MRRARKRRSVGPSAPHVASSMIPRPCYDARAAVDTEPVVGPLFWVPVESCLRILRGRRHSLSIVNHGEELIRSAIHVVFHMPHAIEA